MNIPLLDALKPYKESFNIKYDLNLPTRTPFGNLGLNYLEIVIRIECLNELITVIYDDFESHMALVKSRGGWSNLDEGFKQKFYTEQIFYWLRKTADELIAIVYLLDYSVKNGDFPSQIKIASIGKLLSSKETLDENVDKHIKFLSLLNDISNGFKHSIINAQIQNRRGMNEPVVFALAAFNDVSQPPIYHQVSLRAVLNDYNLFLIDIKKSLEGKQI